MVRSTLAVLLGLLVALAAMLLLEYLGMSLFPLPPGIDLDNEQDLARLVASASIGKKLWVLAGWTVAALAGGWVAARTSRRHRTGAALWVGALIVAGVLLNAALLPHPAWMIVAGVLLPMPVAWFAARLATPRPPRQPT
ncbi:hypothetical protein FZO89_02645 [Luteimonas viscosa]|uniref:Uncharacterized protein n=1 Tax=Luteimonas viscosa TaxID=1132694 RepID=A0A5D4XMS0_9GAMM|nr:hypothetical protein [Luteimonas viscosa]TYT25255.1 hypothetical protein FZO89_02645 [Luteimonas viscosa]